MRNPSFWVVVAYMLAAPFSAALNICVRRRRYGGLNKDHILTAGILGILVLVSFIKGFYGFLNMFPLALLIYCFGVLCTIFCTMECVRKHDAEILGAGTVVKTLSCYILFLVFAVIAAPQLRFCGGCMEWH